MRGHIRKRSKDTWVIVIELPRDPNTNKRRQKWITVKGTKKEAEKELARLINELETGFYVEPAKMTLGSYLDAWLQLKKGKVKETTYREYSKRIKKWKETKIAAKPLQKVTPMDIELVLAGLDVGQQRRKVLLITLKEALSKAVSFKFLSSSPAFFLKNPKVVEKEMAVWTKDEAVKFLETAQKSSYFTLFYLALKTGMRIGELLALQWEGINLKESKIYVKHTLARVEGRFILQTPKTRSAKRVVPIDASTVEIMRKHKKECAEKSLKLGKGQVRWVFWAKKDQPLDFVYVHEIFKRIIKKAEVPEIRFHDLRHTYATFLLSANVHPKIVAERLGHSTMQLTLDRYSHILPDMQQEAVKAAEDFGF